MLKKGDKKEVKRDIHIGFLLIKPLKNTFYYILSSK